MEGSMGKLKFLKNISAKKRILLFLVFFIFFSILFFLYKIGYFNKTEKSDLKISFITDWEYSPEKTGGDKKGEEALKYLNSTLEELNKNFHPHLIVGGGDYIFNSTNEKEVSLKQLKTAIKILKKSWSKKIYCLGARDIKNNSKEEVLKILGNQKPYSSQKIKGVNILIIDTIISGQNSDLSTLGEIDDEQIVWLENEFKKTEPAVIFSHHSLIKTPQNQIWRKNLKNEDKMLELLKKYNNKILAVFSGNNPVDYIAKKSGIPFIVQSGLTNKNSLGRYSEITIKEEGDFYLIKIKNRGENGGEYEIKRKLDSSTDTEIFSENSPSRVEFNQIRWRDLSDTNSPYGIISESAGNETNINITAGGEIVAAFEDKANEGKIRVKIYQNNQWKDLSDEKYPKGLISLGDGGNPNIAIGNEGEIFVAFMEYNYGYRARLLKWSEKQGWQELTPEGFISDTRGHEPVLAFDKKNNFLYTAYAEGLEGDDITDKNPENKKTKIIVKRWDGKNWEILKNNENNYLSENLSMEVNLEISFSDNSIYAVYEEKIGEQHQIKVKKWDGKNWKNFSTGDFYQSNIAQINGSSPSIALDSKDNLFLSFVEDYEGANYIFKFNKEENNWGAVGDGKISSGKNIEPFILITEDDRIFSTYSEYRDNLIFEKNKELIQSGGWRVVLKEWNGKKWLPCEDDGNQGGYVSFGNGKGDPSMISFEGNIYIIFSDEENNYAARVKTFKFN